MSGAKRTVSVSLDADLVAELEEADKALWKQINDAVRETLAIRRRQGLLEACCPNSTKITGQFRRR